MKTPDTLYLQIVDDFRNETDEITWCRNKIHSSNVKYTKTKKAALFCFLILSSFLRGWVLSPFIRILLSWR